MPRNLTAKQETEQQLKDAKALASCPRGWLNMKRIEGHSKIKVIGEWHVKKTDQ